MTSALHWPSQAEGASSGRDRWDAGSALSAIVDEMTLEMGKPLAYATLARASGIVGGFLAAAAPAGFDARPIASRMVIELLWALTAKERRVLASDDFHAIEPKIAAIIGRRIDAFRLDRSGVWIHEPASDTPQTRGAAAKRPGRD